YIRLVKLYFSVLSVSILFLFAMVSQGHDIQLSEKEKAEIMKRPGVEYVCFSEKLSDIKNFIFDISKFDKDKTSPLHEFKRYLRKGFNIGLYDDVIHILEYAELVIRKKALEVGEKKIKPFMRKLKIIIQQVINKELHYDIKKNIAFL